MGRRKGDGWFCQASKERLAEIARESVRKREKNGTTYQPTQWQCRKGSFGGPFLRRIKTPFPEVKVEEVNVKWAARIMGVHVRTMWRWISKEVVKVRRETCWRVNEVSTYVIVQSLKDLHQQFQKMIQVDQTDATA
ncbi:MAG: hypothetical protein A3C88_02415 [Candidatus Yanofskybacteria bacterium RIFCSPHIGHO2_02_FULL_50_12]|uniref:Uncharacterized protein n=1 Tax=Candidatus Yanofskybacteria bacterium RIFCSPHIGHO2_02_FULL_50_12 TaxID=1802685 RepID=A0A1F8FX24_9BACT|nr:MAG: hypothetical protein A3C88_02415 [Candidatus Yanofskybacteria bacterium RIFCSPHIGHO2_02_FULL_50_12]